MKKYISFKHSESSAVGTDAIYTNYNITLNLVPEVLIKQNDTLRMKFSPNVLLKDAPNIEIEGIKGISSILSNESNFQLDKENNEIIISNVFDQIAEPEFVFDDFKANSLIDQEIILTIKNVPIKQINLIDETFYSIEVKTETDGPNGKVITQIDTVPGIAYFYCDYVCKTCNRTEPDICITCKDDFPYLMVTNKKCYTICPIGFYVLDKGDVLECNECKEPCTTCYGNENNCTGCIDGLYLENNTCVKNCSENHVLNEEFNRCYLDAILLNILMILNMKIILFMLMYQCLHLLIEMYVLVKLNLWKKKKRKID